MLASHRKANCDKYNELTKQAFKRNYGYMFAYYIETGLMFYTDYNVKLEDDNVLIDYLNAHISACYHRIYNQEVLDNPYLEEIKRKYPEDFDNLKNNVYLIENGLNISLRTARICWQ